MGCGREVVPLHPGLSGGAGPVLRWVRGADVRGAGGGSGGSAGGGRGFFCSFFGGFPLENIGGGRGGPRPGVGLVAGLGSGLVAGLGLGLVAGLGVRARGVDGSLAGMADDGRGVPPLVRADPAVRLLAGADLGLRRAAPVWTLVLKNLDKHTVGVNSGVRWRDVCEALELRRDVEVAVLCESGLECGVRPPGLRNGWVSFTAARAGGTAGCTVLIKRSRRPVLLQQLINEAMEVNVCVLYEGSWPQVLLAGYIADSLSVGTLERCVVRLLEELLERLKGGFLRCVGSESLAGAPVVFAMDFNARFGASEVVVAGRNLDLEGDQPFGGLPWVSEDGTLNQRGTVWMRMFRSWGIRLINDREETGGVRCARVTCRSGGGSSVIDGIGVEVASGCWSAVVDVHVGPPFDCEQDQPDARGLWPLLDAVGCHRCLCATFQRRVPQLRLPVSLPSSSFRLVAADVSQAQWRKFGNAADAHFMLRPVAERVVAPSIWDSIVGSVRAATGELRTPRVPVPRVVMTVHDKRAVRDLHRAKKAMGNRLMGGNVSRQWVAEAERRVRMRCRVLRAARDRAGRARERSFLLLLARDRTRFQRRFARRVCEVICGGKLAPQLPLQLLNGEGVPTVDKEECTLLLCEQFEKVGLAVPRICDCFTPFAFDLYEPIAAAAYLAVGSVPGPERQCKPFTLDELRRVCLRLKLGKAACMEGFYNDLWHKLAVRLVGEGWQQEWVERPLMSALLDAVNATFARLVPTPDRWMRQVIVPVLKPMMSGRNASDYRDVTLTSNEEKVYARMVELRLREVVEERGILDGAQHGFRVGLGCDTALWQLMCVVEKRALIERKPLFLVFWDVQKAFPSTWRARLVAMLVQQGIQGRLLDAVITSSAVVYERYVRVRGAPVSRALKESRGLSTGHVLSPLLYLLESNDMPGFLRDTAHPGVGVDVGGKRLASGHFADDGVGIATTADGMHHLLRRLEGYMDDARRKFNVEHKATVIMCFNVPEQERAQLSFTLSGKSVAIVDEFKYLGTTISSDMRYGGTKRAHPPSLSRATREAMMQRVNAVQRHLVTAVRARELSVRVLRQVVTEMCSAAEYGSGVMVRAAWDDMERLLVDSVKRVLGVPVSQQGIPGECLMGELGFVSFDARAAMHTLRIWDAIMSRPVDSFPRLAWTALITACDRAGSPDYTLVARVKEVLESVHRSAWFASGLPHDESSPTGYERGASPKELLCNREAVKWRAACAKGMLRDYNMVRTEGLRYQEYLEHPDWGVRLAMWRLRTNVSCLMECLGRHRGIQVADRVCPCGGCDKPNEVESVRHMLLVCSRWNARRQRLVDAVLANPDLSVALREALGGGVAVRPDMWMRLMLGGPLHELGVEYTEPVAQLALRISSRVWRRVDGPSAAAVVRARRALSDREEVVRTVGPKIKAWYVERAVLAGYDGV